MARWPQKLSARGLTRGWKIGESKRRLTQLRFVMAHGTKWWTATTLSDTKLCNVPRSTSSNPIITLLLRRNNQTFITRQPPLQRRPAYRRQDRRRLAESLYFEAHSSISDYLLLTASKQPNGSTVLMNPNLALQCI
ncbi:hypothetical protein PIB30_020440 [Stylosanthes scabra]|uniref:Uncharacterized protein n=1 Tax=Stylosanthes scabra TaxID=79078 RepID=A0ABU6T8W5_9FABA|nr:hypothetical protein [Stylosanthes scabra]